MYAIWLKYKHADDDVNLQHCVLFLRDESLIATTKTANDCHVADIVQLRNVISSEELGFVEKFSINELEVEPLLRTSKNTTQGCDTSLYRAGHFRHVPLSWVAILHPLSIITFVLVKFLPLGIWCQCCSCAHSFQFAITGFHPISVTPILSRLEERLSISNWLWPAIADVDFIRPVCV